MTIITYGTFDLFHYGHYNLLKRASQMGDKLIVGVSSDKMCISKGKITILNQDERMSIVKDLKFVDLVILEDNMEQKILDCDKYGVDVFVLGDDYRTIFPSMPEYNILLKKGVSVVFLPRTEGISSTLLKRKLKEQEEADRDKNSLKNRTNH